MINDIVAQRRNKKIPSNMFITLLNMVEIFAISDCPKYLSSPKYLSPFERYQRCKNVLSKDFDFLRGGGVVCDLTEVLACDTFYFQSPFVHINFKLNSNRVWQLLPDLWLNCTLRQHFTIWNIRDFGSETTYASTIMISCDDLLICKRKKKLIK